MSPWTAAISLRKTDQPIYEVACHEGNYALENILRGARALDGRAPAVRPAGTDRSADPGSTTAAFVVLYIDRS